MATQSTIRILFRRLTCIGFAATVFLLLFLGMTSGKRPDSPNGGEASALTAPMVVKQAPKDYPNMPMLPTKLDKAV